MPGFNELLAHMDATAADLGLRVEPYRTPKSSGRRYYPPRLESGYVGLRSGIGIFTTRGAEFNLQVLRDLGADEAADALLRQLRDVYGFRGAARLWPYVPCESLVHDWERTRRDLIGPYYAARAALAAAHP